MLWSVPNATLRYLRQYVLYVRYVFENPPSRVYVPVQKMMRSCENINDLVGSSVHLSSFFQQQKWRWPFLSYHYSLIATTSTSLVV